MQADRVAGVTQTVERPSVAPNPVLGRNFEEIGLDFRRIPVQHFAAEAEAYLRHG